MSADSIETYQKARSLLLQETAIVDQLDEDDTSSLDRQIVLERRDEAKKFQDRAESVWCTKPRDEVRH